LLLTVLINAQALLLILGASVVITQSYVFAILRTLYSRDVNVNVISLYRCTAVIHVYSTKGSVERLFVEIIATNAVDQRVNIALTPSYDGAISSVMYNYVPAAIL